MLLALRLKTPSFRLNNMAHPQAVVALYSALLIFPMLGSARTFTYHESFTAIGAREMLATGDWLIPRVVGHPWLEKPPLPQWLAAVTGSICGVDEYSARLPAALAGLFGVLMISGLVQRIRGPNAAMITGIFLITMTSIITYARLAEPDIFLWAIVTAALGIFARRVLDPEAPAKWWASPLAFFVLLGLTQTVKGPLFGAVMVLAPCLSWFLLHGFRNAKWCLSPFSWIVMIAIAFAWPAAVLLQYPETLELWKYHTLGRLNAGTAYNAKPFWYYFTTLPWQAAPALVVALPALPHSLRNAWAERGLDRWLWIWVVSQFTLLSIASGKHHHYLIYALPPFAVWAAAGLTWYSEIFRRLWSYRGYRYASTCLALALLGAAAVIAGKKGIISAGEVLAVGGFVLAGLLMMLNANFQNRPSIAAAVLAMTLAGVLLYTNTIWLTRTDLYKPDGELARRIDAATAPGETIVVFGIEPSRLALDIDRRIEWIKEDSEELRQLVLNRGTCIVLTALYFEPMVAAVTHSVEIDRTPRAKWPGRPLSHVIALRAASTSR